MLYSKTLFPRPTPEPIAAPLYTEWELIASICRCSFYQFLREFWDTVISETPVWNWHIEYLCDELQMLAEDVFAGCPKEYDLVINISPGTTKSTICSVMFPAWCWIRMASAKFICGSYAHSLAIDLSRKCRDVIKSDKYQKCFPNVLIREDQDSKEYFVNTAKGSRYSVGVGGSVMGMHGHFIIIDDPLDPQEALSTADMNTANHWMNEVVSRRKVSLSITPTILIMQRLHQNDPTGNRLDRRGDRSPVMHICIPAELADNISPPELKAHYSVDGLMDPVRLGRQQLNEAYDELLEYGYAGQYMQNPIPRGGAMFITDMLKVGRPNGDFKSVVRYWDKAGTQGGGAFTVGLKMGLDEFNHYWILDVVRGQWNTHIREQKILAVAREDGPSVRIGLEQEPGSGGKESAEATMERIAQKLGRLAFINKVGKADGDKEARAEPFSVQVNAGNVWLMESHWNRVYIDELRYFPRSKFKDQVDSSSGAFNYLRKPLITVGGL